MADQGTAQSLNDPPQKQCLDASSYGDAIAQSSGEDLAAAFANPEQRDRNLDTFEELWTPAIRQSRHHRFKDRLGIQKTSRKRGHQNLRKTLRTATAVHHATTTRSVFLQKFVNLPQVQEALRNRRRKKKVDNTVAGNLQYKSAQIEDKPIDTPKTSVPWPSDVVEICDQRNLDGIKFADIGILGKCTCEDECYAFECMNSLSDTYCVKANCALGGQCGNSTRTYEYLRLFKTDHTEIGVFTTHSIECGVNITECCGELEPYEGVNRASEGRVPLKQTTGYSLLLSTRAVRRKDNFVFVESLRYGNIGRFVNHSCEPNCELREVRYRTQARVVILTLRVIEANEEITVLYAGQLWFSCKCPTCIAMVRVPE
ncbi:Variant-silencing SET domain-containing protein [Phytophthora citrophthora]|uniref:Variant-silencing SET domain-containing protein n=1 Tax=Phytophthora citrophthora TaxID=4793 RepID=A0AAD9G0D8_9STRA|nr:Variant-silencing SET domain-containing protein [Phytophthora citrophthora]